MLDLNLEDSPSSVILLNEKNNKMPLKPILVKVDEKIGSLWYFVDYSTNFYEKLFRFQRLSMGRLLNKKTGLF